MVHLGPDHEPSMPCIACPKLCSVKYLLVSSTCMILSSEEESFLFYSLILTTHLILVRGSLDLGFNQI